MWALLPAHFPNLVTGLFYYLPNLHIGLTTRPSVRAYEGAVILKG